MIHKFKLKSSRTAKFGFQTMSPDGKHIAFYTPKQTKVEVYTSETEMLVRILELPGGIKFISWSGERVLILLEDRLMICSFMESDYVTCILPYLENVDRSYLLGNKILLLNHKKIKVVNERNRLVSVLRYELFKAAGMNYLMTLGASVTVFDEKMRILYDQYVDFRGLTNFKWEAEGKREHSTDEQHLLSPTSIVIRDVAFDNHPQENQSICTTVDRESKILDVSIYNRKLYFLLPGKIIGKDLNINVKRRRRKRKSNRLEVLNNFILLKSGKRLLFYTKNLKRLKFELSGDDFSVDSAANKIYMMREENFSVYEENLEDVFRFRLIDTCDYHDESEEEFDFSDSNKDF